jgi:hypothetical protein
MCKHILQRLVEIGDIKEFKNGNHPLPVIDWELTFREKNAATGEIMRSIIEVMLPYYPRKNTMKQVIAIYELR